MMGRNISPKKKKEKIKVNIQDNKTKQNKKSWHGLLHGRLHIFSLVSELLSILSGTLEFILLLFLN